MLRTIKKPSPVKVTPIRVDEEAVQELKRAAELLVVQTADAIKKVVDQSALVCPQSLLLAIHAIKTVGGDLHSIYDKAIKSFLRAHQDRGGKFQSGRVAIAFEPDNRRNVAWKAEAIRLAGELAKLRGKKFNPEKYAARILEATATSDKKQIELTLTEDTN
jgi:hypothetical protein